MARKNGAENMENQETKTMAEGTTGEAEQEPAKKDDYVTFQLFRDSDKYSNDVFVGVNGKTYLIKRGVPVRMPRAVYEVIQNSEEQIYAADMYSEKEAFKEAN